MTTETLIIAGIIVVLVILTFIGLLSRYRKCASDEILVVFGKAGKKQVINSVTGKSEEVLLPSKIIQGGGTFVLPIIQDWRKMSLRPIQMQVEVNGVSNQMIKVNIPVILTTAIGTKDTLMQNAASRFLSATPDEMKTQIKEILIGEMRGLMATMSIEEINADRERFIGDAKKNIDAELNKMGFEILNINTSDIDDDADYIKNLGLKAATKASSQAKADIAEEEKKGDIQIANTRKEREIQVATAEKDRATQVAQTEQEQEIKVAEINQEKEIRLAETQKMQESGIADQQAEQVANIARAKSVAESAKAQAQSEQIANVAKAQSEADSKRTESEATAEASMAKSIAESDSKKAEAEAEKQTRMAQAKEKQNAETIKAIQEKEAKASEFESDARTRAAEAGKRASVAEQNATIEVSVAKGFAEQAKANADKVAGISKVEAQMAINKIAEERQLEVNEATGRAVEAELRATNIIPAENAKKKAIIEGESIKAVAILEAEAAASKILKAAEAQAKGTQLQLEAEAEGMKKKLLAEAEGKRASLMAEAEKVQAIEMAPALAIERMIACGMTPQMVVQYKTIDQLTGIAQAQSEMFEHIHLGEVTVYGNENTAGNFMAKTAENLSPAFDLLRSIPFKETFKDMFGNKAVTEKIVDTVAEFTPVQ